MKNNLLPSLIGVIVSLFAVWWLHGYLLADRCLDAGGTIDYETNLCMAQSNQIIALTTSPLMLVTYCIVIMSVSLVVSSITSKLIKR